MEGIFELMSVLGKEKDDKVEGRLCIRLKIAGHETLCPLTRPCSSYEALELEAEGIKKDLERSLDKARALFRGAEQKSGLGLNPHMAPEEIWSVLSGTEDERAFAEAFNGLDEAKRREIAEYVLTRCNVFSGRAAVFSARYDESSASLQ